ncbi:hypothetical protein PVK06_019355 [Gossypium arboreum]|uniref:SWIM-type domain-containing protein n=1 Tax=Gossypium arboreum TaxID=29729 RepID=A0ABR0PJS7_GOSAR|nr:hypothetical protein PVK06_019355 [Gossypium arboreum]
MDCFHEMLAVLRSVNEEGADYLCNIPFEHSSQAYDGLRFGHMTSNLAECINSVLKGTRHLLITVVVRETYFRLVALFPKRRVIKAKCREAMYEFDKPNQGIIGGQYRVHLRNRTCDCEIFDALRYPCAHVIAACQNLCLDPMTYVNQVYKIEYMYYVYRHVFPPIPDELPHGDHRWLRAGFLLGSASGEVCAALVGIVVPPARDLIMGVGRMTHLDKIMNAEVFASPMMEVFESHKAMGNGKKKSSPTKPRAISHTTVTY